MRCKKKKKNTISERSQGQTSHKHLCFTSQDLALGLSQLWLWLQWGGGGLSNDIMTRFYFRRISSFRFLQKQKHIKLSGNKMIRTTYFSPTVFRKTGGKNTVSFPRHLHTNIHITTKPACTKLRVIQNSLLPGDAASRSRQQISKTDWDTIYPTSGILQDCFIIGI